MSRTRSAAALESESNQLTFCENVTPTSYVKGSKGRDFLRTLATEQLDELTATLGLQDELNPPKKRRRGPAHRRVSQGHIPRPSNAFMLFRTNWVKHTENVGATWVDKDGANTLSLSKAVGVAWKNLSKEEREEWQHKADVMKEVHSRKYPDYKFKPVHKPRQKNGNPPASRPKVGRPRVAEGPVSVTRRRGSFSDMTGIDFEKQREYQVKRNKYLTKQMKLGFKHEELRQMMKRFDDYYYKQGLHPESDSDDDDEFNSDSATVLDLDEAGWNPQFKLGNSSDPSEFSSPATLPYSLSCSPAPLSLPSVPAFGAYQTGSSSTAGEWGFQHLRRSSSVPPVYGSWMPPSDLSATFDPSSQSMNSADTLVSHIDFFPHNSDATAIPATTDFESYGYSQLSLEHRALLGGRRASSAGGMRRSWGTLNKMISPTAQDDWNMSQWNQQWMSSWPAPESAQVPEQLPEVEQGLFQPNFDLSAPTMPTTVMPQDLSVSPLDSVAPDFYGPGQIPIMAPQPISPVPLQEFEPMTMADFHTHPHSPESVFDQGYHPDAMIYSP